MAKVEYAKSRWGDTLFYIMAQRTDSPNVSPGLVTVLRQLQKVFPDCLFLPEIALRMHPVDPQIWSAAAVYGEIPLAGDAAGITPAMEATVRAVVPQAVFAYPPMPDSATRIPDEQQARLNAAVKQGDILLASVYWITACQCVKTAYGSENGLR